VNSSDIPEVSVQKASNNLIAFYDGMTGWVDEERAVDVVVINVYI